jgi:serine/threonine protein phosphatase 1
MRYLAIGDVHGCARALATLLAAVAPRPDDLVVTLGDYVDRGPDSRGVIDQLLALRRSCRLVALRGNHEEMMLEARRCVGLGWQMAGGRATLASYAARPGQPGSPDDVPAAHWDFLANGLRDWYEIDTHFFVHANAYPDVPLDEQPTYMLLWEALEESRPHESGKVMVCGHTQQRSGLPLNLGHAVCIDTWAYGQGWLTCLDVKTDRLWQANQRGELRTGWLDDPPG